MSDIVGSHLLNFPPNSEDEVGWSGQSVPEFHERDLGSVRPVKGMKFPSAALFKAAIKEANIVLGKDIYFQKNSGDKVVIVCRIDK